MIIFVKCCVLGVLVWIVREGVVVLDRRLMIPASSRTKKKQN